MFVEALKIMCEYFLFIFCVGVDCRFFEFTFSQLSEHTQSATYDALITAIGGCRYVPTIFPNDIFRLRTTATCTNDWYCSEKVQTYTSLAFYFLLFVLDDFEKEHTLS